MFRALLEFNLEILPIASAPCVVCGITFKDPFAVQQTQFRDSFVAGDHSALIQTENISVISIAEKPRAKVDTVVSTA